MTKATDHASNAMAAQARTRTPKPVTAAVNSIREVMKFITRDGNEFSDMAAAVAHEQMLELADRIYEAIGIELSDAKDAAEFMMKNYNISPKE